MIRFDEAKHRYFDGDNELISVTKLMAKHGLAPDYSGVPERVLRAKAERGSLIHKEIEDYIKTGEYGFTKEVGEFVRYIGVAGYLVSASEKVVYNDIAAGTIDLLLVGENGEHIIADIKTTSSVHHEAVSWQLSIYNNLAEWGAKKFLVFHFDETGSLRVKEEKPKPVEEVERLFECERNGEIYTAPKTPAIIDEMRIAELAEIERIIAEAKRTKEEAEEREKAIKDALIAAMEQNGITEPIEFGGIRITYVAPHEKKTIDSARLKKELPEVAEQYTNTSTVKAAVRITLKGGDDE